MTWEIYKAYEGSKIGDPIDIQPTELKARKKVCEHFLGWYRQLWIMEKSTGRFALIEKKNKRILITYNDSKEKWLNADGTFVKKKKNEWRPFGL